MDKYKFDHCGKCGLLWPAQKLTTFFEKGMKLCPKCREEVARRVLETISTFKERSN